MARAYFIYAFTQLKHHSSTTKAYGNNLITFTHYNGMDPENTTAYHQLPPTEANIMNERRLEFVGEGIRYWDLLRQGIKSNANGLDTQTFSHGIYIYNDRKYVKRH